MSEEWVYHVDEEDIIIGKVSRKEMRAMNLLHRSVFTFVFNSRRELLVHRRTPTKNVYPHYYSLAFGGCLTYGENYDDGAQRELAEEAGLKEAILVFLFGGIYNGPQSKSIGQVYTAVSDGPFSFQKEEVESARFLSLEGVRKLIEKENVCPDDVQFFEELLRRELWKGK